MYYFHPSGDSESGLAPVNRYVLVHASKGCPALFPSEVTYNDVRDALDSVPDSNAADGRGTWVGPPRVVRHANSCAFHVARLFRFREDIPFILPTHTDALREQIRNRLEPLTQVRSWTVTASEFSPTVNGTLAWWESGDASITRTRDSYPEGAARFTDPEENPIGPTSSATHPTTPSGGGSGDGWFSWGLLIGGAAVAGGIWYLSSKSASREIVIRTDSKGRR